MSRRIRHMTVPLIGLLLLAGCASRDPYRRTDVWQPTGANAANLAAMVANPHDLISGRGDNRQLAKMPYRAVERIWTGTANAAGSAGATSGSSGSAGASAISGTSGG